MLSARPRELILGEFVVPEFKTRFDYCKTSDKWALAHNLPFEIETVDGHRFARILKTVAYVAVDEQEDGAPKLEKWVIRHQWERSRVC